MMKLTDEIDFINEHMLSEGEKKHNHEDLQGTGYVNLDGEEFSDPDCRFENSDEKFTDYILMDKTYSTKAFYFNDDYEDEKYYGVIEGENDSTVFISVEQKKGSQKYWLVK